jgi:hypothetical protein
VLPTSLEKAEWNNTRLVTGGVADAISDLKRQDGKDLAIFGRPTLTVSQLDWTPPVSARLSTPSSRPPVVATSMRSWRCSIPTSRSGPTTPPCA